MDESLGACAIDISGRPLCVFEADLPPGTIAGFDNELAEEFFRAVASTSRMTLHVGVAYGSNAHHMIEACFKAFARALREAVSIDPDETGRPLDEGHADLRPAYDRASATTAWATCARSRRRSPASGRRPRASPTPRRRASADGLILPGVGAFPEAMSRIRAQGFDALIAERAAAGVPCSGICLGMQLIFGSSTELEGATGLGLLEGEVTELDAKGQKVPHIGWAPVTLDARVASDRGPRARGALLLRPLARLAAGRRRRHARAPPTYGETFAAVVERGNVFGVQFHPEKSSSAGLRLLENFAAICSPVPA